MGVEVAITPAISSEAELPSSPASFKTTLPPSEKPARKIGAPAWELADHRQQVGRLAGMIERAAAQVFGAAAASHVEAMGGATGFERGLGQAARVARGTGTFQSMNQNQMGDGFDAGACEWTRPGRPARCVKLGFHGKRSSNRDASSCRRW